MPNRSRFADLLTEFKQAKDEIRLQLHLAGMEARAQWEKIEPTMDDLERRMVAVGDAATHELEAAAAKVSAALAKLRADLKQPPATGPRL